MMMGTKRIWIVALLALSGASAGAQVIHTLAAGALWFDQVDGARRLASAETVSAETIAAVDALGLEVAQAAVERLAGGYPFDVATREALIQAQVYAVVARVRGAGADLETAGRETVSAWASGGVSRADVLQVCVKSRTNKVLPYCRAFPEVFVGIETSLDAVESMRDGMRAGQAAGKADRFPAEAMQAGRTVEDVRTVVDRRATAIALRGYRSGGDGVTLVAMAMRNEIRAGSTLDAAAGLALERLATYLDGVTSGGVDWRADVARGAVCQTLQDWKKNKPVCRVYDDVSGLGAAIVGALDAGVAEALRAYEAGDVSACEAAVEATAARYRSVAAGLALRLASERGAKSGSGLAGTWAMDAAAQSVVRSGSGLQVALDVAAEALRARAAERKARAGKAAER